MKLAQNRHINTLGGKKSLLRGTCSRTAAQPRTCTRLPLPIHAQSPSDKDDNEDHFKELSSYEDHAPALAENWRTFRARLVARETGLPTDNLNPIKSTAPSTWCHGIPNPEPGCLLVARHNMLGLFNWTIILILEHSDADGTVGLVINMPTRTLIRACGVDEGVTTAFGNLKLGLGGPVQRETLHILHTRPDIDDASEILPGLFCGGIHSAADLVMSGEAAATEFHMFAGYSGWGPYQLAHEIEREDWWVFAASPEAVIGILRESVKWEAPAQGQGSDDRDVRQHCWRLFVDQAGLLR